MGRSGEVHKPISKENSKWHDRKHKPSRKWRMKDYKEKRNEKYINKIKQNENWNWNTVKTLPYTTEKLSVNRIFLTLSVFKCKNGVFILKRASPSASSVQTYRFLFFCKLRNLPKSSVWFKNVIIIQIKVLQYTQ